MGSEARGKCSARTSPRFPEIARTPAITELCVKVKTKTPVTRKGMKTSWDIPFLVPRISPKIKK